MKLLKLDVVDTPQALFGLDVIALAEAVGAAEPTVEGNRLYRVSLTADDRAPGGAQVTLRMTTVETETLLSRAGPRFHPRTGLTIKAEFESGSATVSSVFRTPADSRTVYLRLTGQGESTRLKAGVALAEALDRRLVAGDGDIDWSAPVLMFADGPVNLILTPSPRNGLRFLILSPKPISDDLFSAVVDTAGGVTIEGLAVSRHPERPGLYFCDLKLAGQAAPGVEPIVCLMVDPSLREAAVSTHVARRFVWTPSVVIDPEAGDEASAPPPMPISAALTREIVIGQDSLTPGAAYRMTFAAPAAPPARALWLLIRYRDTFGATQELMRSFAHEAVDQDHGQLTLGFRVPAHEGPITLRLTPFQGEDLWVSPQGRLDQVAPPIPPAWLRLSNGPPNNDTYQPMAVPLDTDRPPLRRGLAPETRIAFVGSAELAQSLSFECDLLALPGDAAEAALEAAACQLLLIETAHGTADPLWARALMTPGDPDAPGPLARLVAAARRLGLPVVVWLRLDPLDLPHYAWLLPLADQLFAGDAGVAAALALEGRAVDILAPAVQPRLHHPFKSPALAREAQVSLAPAIDGWWDVAGKAEVKALEGVARNVHLIESRWDYGGIRLPDSGVFQHGALGCLTPEARRAVARLWPINIHLADGVEAPWRRLERMLEYAAAGSIPVLAGDARRWGGLEVTPPLRLESSLAKATDEAIALMANPVALGGGQLRALREVLAHHTIADRLAAILGAAGLDVTPAPPPRICVLASSRRPQLIGNVVDWFRRQAWPHAEMVVVMHGEAAPADLAARIGDAPIRVITLSAERTLGDCLNTAAAMSQADYFAKVDDDDLYGDHYLSDFALLARHFDVAVAGKSAALYDLRGGAQRIWLPERADQAWTWRPGGSVIPPIAGGTLIFRRDVRDAVPFSDVRRGGSDSLFIRQALQAGFDLMTLDSLNYIQFRSAEQGFHTWSMDEAGLLTSAMAVQRDGADNGTA